MKVIVAGSRTISMPSLLGEVVGVSTFDITEVVSGRAKGADQLGELWATFNNVPIKMFPANWDAHGKKAGIMRNCVMGDYADALIALWDGKSRGTFHMISYMLKLGKPVCVFNTTVQSYQVRRGGDPGPRPDRLRVPRRGRDGQECPGAGPGICTNLADGPGPSGSHPR